MAKGARVGSVAELAAFQAFLAQMAEAVRHGVGEADAEVRRVERWLTEDRPAELAAAGRRAGRMLETATEDLRRKRMQPTPTGAPPSIDVERRQHARAKAATEQVETLKRAAGRWGRAFSAEATEYTGQVLGAREMPDGLLPQARAQLQRHLVALEAYVNESGGSGVGSASVARPAEEPAADAAESTDGDVVKEGDL